MSCAQSFQMRCRIDGAIRVLCPIIEGRISARKFKHWREIDLRRELVGCLMGSQVRHEMAVTATKNLEQVGLLDDVWWIQDRNDDFGIKVFEVLTGQKEGLEYPGKYRFPMARTNQLVQMRNALAKLPLTDRLDGGEIPRRLRKDLVAKISGIGPKQASMFLRNIGKSYDLAILDSHVLRFMAIQELLPAGHINIGTFTGYEKVELAVINYANSLGYPPGYLDWAIWATMKAAKELGL